MTIEEYNDLAHKIRFDFAKDNYFTELKDNEIAEARVNLARNFQDMAGKYYSHHWIRKNILKQTDDVVAEEDVNINAENEAQEPRWVNPAIEQNMQMIAQHNAQMQQMDGSQDQQSPEDQGKYEQVRQALITVNQMKKKGVDNRSMQEQSAYKQAVQIIAKNPEIAKQMSSNLGGQQQ